MNLKDYFSTQAIEYARYRPNYPQKLFVFLRQITKVRDTAIDIGTGNGQVAIGLAPYFRQIIGIDISINQLKVSHSCNNINFCKCTAEHICIQDRTVNLIVAGQSMHWFYFNEFFREVERIAVPDAVIAAWGYMLPRITDEVDHIINDFYRNIVGKFWPSEREYIEQYYNSIPFPVKKIPSPEFSMTSNWNCQDLIGYLKTWSAVQLYIKENKENPVMQIKKDLEKVWGNTKDYLQIRWPFFLKAGKIQKK